jgi:L-threonylcarbamoyladenylate synthase
VNFWHLKRAVQSLRRGDLIAYPTESVFGLGCDPYNPDAVADILSVKRRAAGQGLILLGSSVGQFAPFLDHVDAITRQMMDATWPGPVTWVVPCSSHVPGWLRAKDDTVAIRITAHPLAAALCRAFGDAIVSTSANLRGRRPARSELQVRLRLTGVDLDYILPGATGNGRRPSEIRDARTHKVLRLG